MSNSKKEMISFKNTTIDASGREQVTIEDGEKLDIDSTPAKYEDIIIKEGGKIYVGNPGSVGTSVSTKGLKTRNMPITFKVDITKITKITATH